jgi:Ca2+-transporting ATPase
LEQFEDSTLKILLVAATLTLIIGLFSANNYQWIEGASIYFAVAFIALFASGTNHLKEKQFLKLEEEIKNEEVNVIRGQYGLSQPVKVADIVVGDVILIETGMRVPTDCLLLQGMDVEVDESPYFEDRSTIVPKSCSVGHIKDNNHTDNPDPFLLAESLVMSGSGRAVVCAVGHNCYLFEVRGEPTLVGIGANGEDSMTPL